jgi:quercetin dioxygenase-like cupin family protein
MTEATALRALGILGGEPLVRLMSRIREGDAALEDDLLEMERTAATLALTLHPVSPPPELLLRVISRASSEGYYFHHERDSEWEPTVHPGSYVRRLYIDSRGSRETRLVRLTAASPPGALAALAGASFYVIAGDLHVDGVKLEARDHFSTGGTSPTGRTDQGCVLFTVRGAAATRGLSRTREVVRDEESDWVDAAPGVTSRMLGEDAERGLSLSILRMDPGTTWPAHHHDGAEEVFLVRGDWRCLGTNLHPGDYHRAGANTEHEDTTSAAGCKLIVVRHLSGSAEE